MVVTHLLQALIPTCVAIRILRSKTMILNLLQLANDILDVLRVIVYELSMENKSANLDTQSLPQLSMRMEYVTYLLHKMAPWL